MIGLGAIGVTLTYSILRFANFAHGEFISWGAYFALVVAGALGALSGSLTAPIGPVLLRLGAARSPRSSPSRLNGGLALLVDALLFGRLRAQKSTVIIMVMASFGAALTLRSLLEFIFTSQPLYFSKALQIAHAARRRHTRDARPAAVARRRGRAGRRRASASDRAPRSAAPCAPSARIPQLAGVAGIEVRKVIRIVWLLGAGLACDRRHQRRAARADPAADGPRPAAAAVRRRDPRRHRQRAGRHARRR